MLKKLFAFDKETMSVRREIGAGITTFLSMCYILAVHPAMLELAGMPLRAVFTSTVLIATIGTLLLAFIAKMPFAIAPGMGLNAFIVFSVCQTMGHTFEFALTAVVLEGIIFLILTLTNVLEKIDHTLPTSLKNAICAGIGLFIAVIGVKSCGILIEGESSIPQLGTILSAEALLAIIGFGLIVLLYKKKVKGCILLGLIITAVIGIPLKITTFEGSLFSSPSPIAPILLKFEWQNIFSWDMLTIVATLAFVDIFSIIGTFVGLCGKANLLDSCGNIVRVKRGFIADSLSIIISGCIGTTTTTVYIESGAGVLQGGRSGLTAAVTAICFATALFLSPLFLAIPTAATAPVLIFVGLSMLLPIKEIFKNDWEEWLPALICTTLMPLLNSISDGIFCGIIAYTTINIVIGKHNRITPLMYILTAIFIIRYILMWL